MVTDTSGLKDVNKCQVRTSCSLTGQNESSLPGKTNMMVISW